MRILEAQFLFFLEKIPIFTFKSRNASIEFYKLPFL